MNFQSIKFKLILSAWVAWVFSQVFLDYLPLFFYKPIFLVAPPILMLLVIASIIHPSTLLVVILFTRAALESVLSGGRFSLGGFNTGVGGMVNFLVIIFGCAFFVNDPKVFRRVPLIRSWAIFLFVCAAGVIYSPAKGPAVKLWLNLLTYGVMFAIPFLVIHGEAELKFWLKAFTFSSVVPVVGAYVDLFRGGQYFADAGIRIAGTFSHPNVLAFYVLLNMVAVFYFLKAGIFRPDPAQKFILFMYGVCLMVLLLATKTRSAWIAGWLFFFLYGIFKDRKYVIISILVPAVLLLHPSILHRIKDVFENTGGDIQSGLNSLAWRKELWRRSLEEIKTHPAIGQGLESFTVLSKDFFPAAKYGVQPHNSYVQVLFETGAVGLSAFLFLLFGLCRQFVTKARAVAGRFSQTAAIGLSLSVGYVAICASDNLLYYLTYNWYFFFFVGTLLRFGQIHASAK